MVRPTRWPKDAQKAGPKLARAFVQDHPYFAGLEQEVLEDVLRAARVRELSRGQMVALEGDPCTSVCFVMLGRVDAVKLSIEGRRQVIYVLQAGEVFYLVPALEGAPLPASTVASTRSLLLCFEREAFLRLLDRHPRLMRPLLADLATRLRRLGDLVADLSLRSVSERVARHLLDRAEGKLPDRMTQRDMAAQLGTVREVVARCLARFQDEGWIRVGRGVIEVLDAEALRLEVGE